MDAAETVREGYASRRDIRRGLIERLSYDVGVAPNRASDREWFIAAALAARDAIVDRLKETGAGRDEPRREKEVCYLSLEFLVGRLLGDTLGNLGLAEDMRAALAEYGLTLERIAAVEPDAALGNGGLGRLAACFMESMATLGIPAMGYGIRYEHGLFRQLIVDGAQQEAPEDWLSSTNPWEFERRDIAHDVCFGGAVEMVPDGPFGELRAVWKPTETVRAVAFDTAIAGYGGRRVNMLRLWSARAVDPLRLADFNRGDHAGAHTDRLRAEAISRVLYPGDDTAAGQELRLRQEYFFVSASLQDLLKRVQKRFGHVRHLPEAASVQMNDTHPSLAVPELMRLLIDVHGLPWTEAWSITRRTLSYTNHTLLPEALESWPLALVERLLPRQMQIVYLINARHLEEVRHREDCDTHLLASVSLIDEQHGRRVRMGHLAFLGSHRVNGVSALHTDLMRRTIFADLDRVCPGRIVNKTNGITFRRWLHRANPALTALLVDVVGEAVLTDPERLQDLVPFADDTALHARMRAQRLAAKTRLAALVQERTGVRVDPAAMFDVQIKRVHEYKRQLLNILHAVALYQSVRVRPGEDWAPRVKIFAGKAAAGYHRAKQIIQLAHDVARVINADPAVRDLLKVVWMPNYNVSLAEAIVPAADLSEQISTAGMEASGTGNMKLGLNGALTIGTLDGANVEMRERVHADNIFICGMHAEEVATRRAQGLDARADIAASPALAETLDAIRAGVFSPDERNRYADLVHAIECRDPFMVAADFESYRTTQIEVATAWLNPQRWWRSSLLNTARLGWFSSDRTIRDYAADIWDVPVSGG